MTNRCGKPDHCVGHPCCICALQAAIVRHADNSCEPCVRVFTTPQKLSEHWVKAHSGLVEVLFWYAADANTEQGLMAYYIPSAAWRPGITEREAESAARLTDFYPQP